jgi:hypothetical protein
MPRGVKKENLPSKICPVCNRPFTWRKKWEKCWDEVITCSKSCNFKRREDNQKINRLQRGDIDEIDSSEGKGDLRQIHGQPVGSISSPLSSTLDVTEELSRLTVVSDEKQDDSSNEGLDPLPMKGIYSFLW